MASRMFLFEGLLGLAALAACDGDDQRAAVACDAGGVGA